tara:strand:- start:387 stop:4280 length:3894 start_codon:yes stop_codon:yes gene_type:complete
MEETNNKELTPEQERILQEENENDALSKMPPPADVPSPLFDADVAQAEEDQNFEEAKELRDNAPDESTIQSNIVESVAAPVMGVLDLGLDVVGMIPGGESIDNAWDEATKYKNPGIQKVRDIFGLVLPTMVGAGAAVRGIQGISKLPTLMKGLAAIGATGAIDGAVTYVSDTTDEGDNLMRMLDDTAPWLNIPENWQTLDADSPEVRKHKNTYEAVGLSVVGDVLGYGINLAKILKGGRVPDFMSWFKPADETAANYKAAKELEAPSAMPGDEGIEVHTRTQASLREWQQDEIAIRKLEADPESVGYDPFITPKLSTEADRATFSVPPAAAAKNMADSAAIDLGMSKGSAASPVTSPQLAKMADGSTDAREVILDVQSDVEASGQWALAKQGVEIPKPVMDQLTERQYSRILEIDDDVALKKALYENASVIGDLQVSYLNESSTRAAALALRDLAKIYLGNGVRLTSTRVLNSTAGEISDIADAAIRFKEVANPNRIRTMVLDRMELVMQEYGLSKYIAGWSLNNKKIFTSKAYKDNPDEVIQYIRKNFDEKRAEMVKKSKDLRTEIDRLYEVNPNAIEPLMSAFSMSKGDITSQKAMLEWASNQVKLKGYLVSPDGNGMNMLAQGLWAVRYNNVLSGISALRAIAGNTTSLMVKPITAMMGHGIEGIVGGDFKNFKRAWYGYGSYMETNARALGHAWEGWKKANADPQAFMDMARKDRVVIRDEQQWELLQSIADTEWSKSGTIGDAGKLMLHGWAKANKHISEWAFMRYGTNAMIASDQYVTSTLATQAARMRAYDEVFEATGKVPSKRALVAAERKLYDSMFDKNGLITDDAVKHSSSEIALNLDTKLTDDINSFTASYPGLKALFMFPRTGINAMRLGLSYTPLARLGPSSRYSKILTAGNDQDKIFEALLEHGVKQTDPNAMNIYRSLKAEYKGRIAFGTMLTAGLLGYAVGGNIRGNGPVNAAERRAMRDNYGWKPKEINIGGKWVSYSGLEPFDTLLTLIGDLGYYATDLGSELTEDLHHKISWTIAAGFTNKTFMSGLEPLVKLLSGDSTAFARLVANEGRSYIPLSGAAGVLAKAISSSQKDIHADFYGYVQNNIPGFNTALPERIDVWTGKPINDIDNPVLRFFNALNPVPISDGIEPWRKWLLETGWDGMKLLRKTSDGKYDYTPEERTEVYKYMGRMDLYKEVEKLMKSPRIKHQLDAMRRLRASNQSYDFVTIKTEGLPVYDYLNNIVREAQILAEQQMNMKNPTIADKIKANTQIKHLVKQGKSIEAGKIADGFQIDFNNKDK